MVWLGMGSFQMAMQPLTHQPVWRRCLNSYNANHLHNNSNNYSQAHRLSYMSQRLTVSTCTHQPVSHIVGSHTWPVSHSVGSDTSVSVSVLAHTLKPVSHSVGSHTPASVSVWAHTLQPVSHNVGSHTSASVSQCWPTHFSQWFNVGSHISAIVLV